jgi:hypothetical protein
MDINTPEGINTSDEDKLFALLSEKELEVMYWACQGYTIDEIADIRQVGSPTVKTQLGNVYKRLEFPMDISDNDKREYLISNYASAINKLFPDRKSLDSLHERKMKWEVKNLQKRREPKSEIDQKLNVSKETRVITEPTPRARLNQSFLRIGLGVLGVIVIAVILVLAIGNNGQGEIIPTTVAEAIQPTSTVQQIPLIEVSTSEPIATSTPSTVNDIAPLPTPTHTYTPLPTDTPLPTSTTAFTNTPANTITPELTNTPTETPTITLTPDRHLGEINLLESNQMLPTDWITLGEYTYWEGYIHVQDEPFIDIIIEDCSDDSGNGRLDILQIFDAEGDILVNDRNKGGDPKYRINTFQSPGYYRIFLQDNDTTGNGNSGTLRVDWLQDQTVYISIP